MMANMEQQDAEAPLVDPNNPDLIRPLVEMDNPILHEELPLFDFNGPAAHQRAVEVSRILGSCMLKYGGVGLAANQIGLREKAFVIKATPQLIVCFNPKIVFYSPETSIAEEGCLSFPYASVKVERSLTIRIRYQQPNGKVAFTKWEGLTARIAQHEYDHVHGVVMFDRVSKLKARLAREKASKKKRIHGTVRTAV